VDADWAAVAEAINTRLAELKMTQQELAQRSGVSVATLRQLQRNYQPKRRSPRTLAAISEGLRWPSQHLSRVLEGAEPLKPRGEVETLRAAVEELSSRVVKLEGAEQIAAVRADLDDVHDRLARIEAAQRRDS
jgi:transcriptional regulator with XRE-family HTH domain